MTNPPTFHPILGHLGRYLWALGFVGAGFGLCWSLPQVLAPRPFLAFWPMVVLAAELGGLGPGVFATIASVACVHLMLGPSHSGLNLSDWIGATATGIFLAGGWAISAFIGGKRKIQSRQLLQAAAVVANAARYRSLFEAANVGKSVTLPSGEIEVNQAFCDMLGYSPEELRGKTWQELTPPEDVAAVSERLAPLLRGEQHTARFEKRYRHTNGSLVWADVSATLLRDAAGRPLHFITTIVDITQRKETEHKARQSHDLLANLTRLVPGVVYQYRLFPDGRSAFPYASAGMNEIYEVTPAEVQEDATPVFGRLHPDDSGRVSDLIQESARSLQTFHCEFRVILPRQGLRWRWSQAQPERMEDGGTLWHGIISDITERKQTEALLLRTDRALRMISECHQQLISASSETAMLQAICRIIVELGGYRMAWIGFAEPNEAKSVRPVAQAGFEAGYLETVDITWADTERGRGPTGTAIRTGQPVIARNIPNEPNYDPWRAEAIRRGYASSASLPLIVDGRAFGALMVYAAEPDVFRGEELAMLAEFANDLAFGIAALRGRAKREQAEAALQETNDRLTAVMENLSEGLIMADEQGQTLYWNPAALAMNGYTSMDDCRRRLADFTDTFEFRLLDEDRPLPVADWPMSRMIRGEKLHNWAVRLRRLDQGWEKIVAYSGWLIHRTNSDRLAFLSVTDITERRRAEEKLSASEREFRTLAEALPQIVWVTRADGGNIYLNRQWKEYTGLTLEEGYGAGWTKPFHPEDEPRAAKAWQNATQNQGDYNIECRLRRADGIYRWWLIRGTPLCDVGGQVLKWFGTCTDIEDLKQSEQTLRASEVRYRRLFETAKDGILILDAETGMIVDVNPFLVEMLGYSHEVFLNKKVWDLGFLKNLVANEANFAELQAKEYIRYDDMALETSDGRRIEVEFISNVYRVGGRKVIQCNIREITARVEAEKKIQRTLTELEQARQVLLSVVEDEKSAAEQLRKLSAVIEQAPLSVVITDLAGTIEYVNPHFTRVTGYAPEEVLGHNPRVLKSGETPPDIYRAMWSALTRGEVWTGELRNRSKRGELILESAVIAPVVDAHGRATHYVALKDDITAQRRATAETAAQLEKEHQVSEMKTRFISVTSHEFRTPMAAALGSVEILANHLDRLDPPKRAELLARIASSLHRMNEMLDEMLLLNRIDANRVDVKPSPVALRSFLANEIEEIRLGDRDGHRFALHPSGDGAPFVTDPGLLHHMISNLLSNAVRYSRSGTLVTVHLDVTAERLRVTVEDEGIGIPENDRPRLFDAFERGSNVGTIKGTGLGLNIVKRMTELLGGTITLEPSTGIGCRFTLQLPPLPNPAPSR